MDGHSVSIIHICQLHTTVNRLQINKLTNFDKCGPTVSIVDTIIFVKVFVQLSLFRTRFRNNLSRTTREYV